MKSKNIYYPQVACGDEYKFPWGWIALLAVVTMVLFVVRTTLPVKDSDLFFHLLYGQYFWQNHTLIADHTLYSWTPSDNDTIYCTWLGSTLLYLIHKISGFSGLFLFRYLCMGAPILAGLLYARKHNLIYHPLSWLLLINAIIMSYAAAFLKPEMLSLVFMTLATWNWFHIRSQGVTAWRYCYLFPLIMLLWVNTHGAFVFGAIFYFLIGLGELLNTWLAPHNSLPRKLKTHLFAALFLSAFSVFINPYGYHYIVQLFFELLPTTENMNANKAILAYAATFSSGDSLRFTLVANISIATLLALMAVNFRKVEWSLLLTNLFFAYLYTAFLRTTYFWAPVCLFSGLYLLSDSKFSAPNLRRMNKWFKTAVVALVTIVAVYSGGNTIYLTITRPEPTIWLGFGISDFNPVEEAEYIAKKLPDLKIANTYNAGAYLMWRLWPERKIFIDARSFPYNKWKEEYFSTQNSKEAFYKLIDKYPADLWCIDTRNNGKIHALLIRDDWKLAFYGRAAAVIVRSDIPLPADNQHVSDAIDKGRNVSQIFKTFETACLLGDYQTADKILATLETSRILGQKRFLSDFKDYLAGVKAYRAEEYNLAAKKLARFHRQNIFARAWSAASFSHCAVDAWENGDFKKALFDSDSSVLVLSKNNPHGWYNRGVVGKYIMEHDLMQMDPDYDWRDDLKEFIKTYSEVKGLEKFVDNAQKILQGKMEVTEKTELIRPPKPDKRILYNKHIDS